MIFCWENFWFWHHDKNHLPQTPMQTKHIWDCHKQSQAPVIWNFMSFQWLRLHEPLTDELSQWSFTVLVDGIVSNHRVSLYRWDIWAQVLNIMRHSCAGFSKPRQGIFYKQGWSWSWRWGGVTCTGSGTGLLLFYPSGQFLNSTWI